MALRSKSPRVKSPCVDVCTMDTDSGYCRGCRRTLEEIAGWPRYTDADRRAVLARLEARTVSPTPSEPAVARSQTPER